MHAARDVAIVAGLRRRLAAADAVTLTNFAWFAARRGLPAIALDALQSAQRDPATADVARRAADALASGATHQLVLRYPGNSGIGEARELGNWGIGELATRARDPNAPFPIPQLPNSPTPRLSNSPIPDLREGRDLLAQGKLEDALLVFDQLLDLNPGDPSARFHRGVVLAKLRRYADALHEWEVVGRIDPDGRLGVLSRRHARSARELASLFVGR